MSNHFPHCHTPEEIKAQYRYWSKKLHPDMGGNDADFRNMHNEYESAIRQINGNINRNTLPEYFDKRGSYEYYFRAVKYVGVYYNHYYKFIQDFGADILIDIDHVRLIFEKRRGIAA